MLRRTQLTLPWQKSGTHTVRLTAVRWVDECPVRVHVLQQASSTFNGLIIKSRRTPHHVRDDVCCGEDSRDRGEYRVTICQCVHSESCKDCSGELVERQERRARLASHAQARYGSRVHNASITVKGTQLQDINFSVSERTHHTDSPTADMKISVTSRDSLSRDGASETHHIASGKHKYQPRDIRGDLHVSGHDV